jgi:hypothetical protein
MRPMLDELELPQVQVIDTGEHRDWVEHQPPGMAGSIFEDLGRDPTDFLLHGVAVGPESLGFVERLDGLFRAGQPVSFVADITTATQIDQVVIEDLAIREVAGKPERYEYALTLHEFVPPPVVESEELPPPEPEPPENPDELIDKAIGRLEVEVTVEGQPGFDFSRVLVTAEGTRDDGTPFSQVLTNRTGNRWIADEMPAGEYTIHAVVLEGGTEV